MEKVKRTMTFLIFLSSMTLLFAYPEFSSATQADCTALMTYMEGLTDEALNQPVANVTATWHDASESTPEYCEVKGRIFPEIDFAVRLPTDWNNRFIHFVSGGNGGSVARVDSTTINLGYASSASNDGHDATQYPNSAVFGLKDPYFREYFPEQNKDNPYACQMLVDFGIRAHRETPIIAKKIINQYYGGNPDYTYYSGMSRGGMNGLTSAQKNHDIFDGFLLYCAPVGQVAGMFRGLWNNIHGAPMRESWTTDKQIALYEAVYEKCDGVDGLVDGLIDDPRQCTFDPITELPACPDDVDSEGCFTLEQRQSLKYIYDGAYDSTGQALSAGSPVSAEYLTIGAGNNPVSGFTFSLGGMSSSPDILRYWFFDPPPGPDWDVADFDWDEDPYEIRKTTCTQCYDDSCDEHTLYDVLDPGTFSPNPVPRMGGFAPLKAKGGKIIQFHGWSDPFVSPLAVTQWYEGIMKRMGKAATKSFYKLYMVPGTGHCGGGIGCNQTWIDAFNALVNWVENSIEPDSFTGTRNANTDYNWHEFRTRPICRYPEVARWNGIDSIEDAESFMCVPPIEVRIKPQVLKLKRKGKFTAFITVPGDYHMKDWNLQNITCEGAPAIFGRTHKNVYIVKFHTQDMQDVTPGKLVTLTVKGEFYKDGETALVQASDMVRVIKQ
ncbi:MAG: tannase/feruloyl esterase family alpha/beta hydrolase [Deltaproteobacteria bacterium]|nr:tannase/feruloyl esterase family alpha/beta hydrolase [Deltaproteobacteria bacterium]